MEKTITLTEKELHRLKNACGQVYILSLAIGKMSSLYEEPKAEFLGLDSLAHTAHEESWRLMCELESRLKEA